MSPRGGGQGPDDDPTIRIGRNNRAAPVSRVPRPGRLYAAIGLVAVLLLAGLGGYFALRPAAPPAIVASIPAPVPAPAPIPVPAPATPPAATAPPQAQAFAARTADERTIAAHVPTTLTLFRFAQNPRVLVLDFPTLLQQGQMLNRLAAMVEKIGLPHDRVLTDAELDAAIRRNGDTVETYYYGHDYPAADVAAFFANADRQHVKLGPEEERLRALATAQGLLTPGSRDALISIPRAGAAAGLDATMRAAILHHELSHGEFFSNPTYAAYVRHYFNEVLPPAARQAFTNFLAKDDYDPAVPDLIANETQAYLMNTSDPRLFNAAELGMSEAALVPLRTAFLAGMPAGWLRDAITAQSMLSSSAPSK